MLAEGTIGTWKKDVLFMLDELTEGPQVNMLWVVGKPIKLRNLYWVGMKSEAYASSEQ